MRPTPGIALIGTFAVLVFFSAMATRYAGAVPSARDESAAVTEFSAGRAMTHVRALAQRPRPIGSAEHARARGYLIGELARLGVPFVTQEATGVGTRYAVVGRVTNLIARLPGTSPGGPAVLLMAHYDGVAAGPAAADDASGCAVLLETLRALKAGAPLTHDVIALFADGEEEGLLGAAAFAREHPWARDVEVTLNFEARGTHGPSLMFETGAGNLDVVRVLRAVGGARATSLSTTVYRSLPNDTDLSEIAVLGKPALNFAFIGGVARYHTAEDDPEHLDPRSVQDHGEQALALTRAFGAGPLPRPATSDAVFFDAPLLGLVAYPMGWAVPFAAAAMLLVVGAIVRARGRAALRMSDLLLGAVTALLALVAASLLGIAIAMLLQRLHVAMGSGVPTSSGVYAAGIALAAAAIALASFATARRWASRAAGLQLGALLLWSGVSLLCAALLPGVSFLLTWPVLFAALAALVLELNAPGWLRVGARLVAGGVVATLVVPTLYLMVVVALGVDRVGGALLGAFTAFGIGLLVSQLSRDGVPAWRAPVAVAVVAVAVLVAGTATVRTNAARPSGSSLVYAIDADSGKAFLAGGGTGERARGWIRSVLEHAGDTSRVTAPHWLGASRTARVPRVADGFLPAAVSVIADSIAAGARWLSLRVVPHAGTRNVAMQAHSGRVDSAIVDGRAIATERYRYRARQWRLEYAAPPPQGFTLTLLVSASPVELGFTSRYDTIPPLPRAPARPVGVLESHSGDRTLVHQRARF